MRTDDLVAVLARSAQPVDGRRVARQFWGTLAVGAALCVLAMFIFLGPRPDWRGAMQLPMFWLKLGFPAAVALAAVPLLRRLATPGERLGRLPAAVVPPFALVWLMAAAALMEAPTGTRVGLVLGATWWQCPLTILALAVPALALAFSALRAMAPTRLTLAGAAAGLFAGSAAAFAYAISCAEMQAPFLGTWYVLGMLLSAGIGALLGRRLLHW